MIKEKNRDSLCWKGSSMHDNVRSVIIEFIMERAGASCTSNDFQGFQWSESITMEAIRGRIHLAIRRGFLGTKTVSDGRAGWFTEEVLR